MTKAERIEKIIEEKWNENVEKCSGCGIEWKKIGKQCPVCFTPAERKNVSIPAIAQELEEEKG